MRHNYDIIKINADTKNSFKVINLIEEICDRYNLHNYFGIFSISADEVVNQIINNKSIDMEDFLCDFLFEQCVGGVVFSFKSNQEIFYKPSEISELLSNKIMISEDNKSLEMIFFVNGIDESELKTRQNLTRNYILIKSSPRTKISHGD